VESIRAEVLDEVARKLSDSEGTTCWLLSRTGVVGESDCGIRSKISLGREESESVLVVLSDVPW